MDESSLQYDVTSKINLTQGKMGGSDTSFYFLLSFLSNALQLVYGSVRFPYLEIFELAQPFHKVSEKNN